MDDEEEWVSEISDVAASCTKLIKLSDIDEKDQGEMIKLCQTYFGNFKELPSESEINTFKMIKLAKISDENEQVSILNKFRQMKKFKKKFKSLVDIILLPKKGSQNLEGSKKLELKDVFFDTGGESLEVGSGACKFLGIKGDKEMLFEKRNGMEDKGYYSFGDVCIKVGDEGVKCYEDALIKCLTNLEDKKSFMASKDLVERGLAISDYDEEGHKKRSEQCGGYLGDDLLFWLVHLDPKLKDIQKPLVILFDPLLKIGELPQKYAKTKKMVPLYKNKPEIHLKENIIIKGKEA